MPECPVDLEAFELVMLRRPPDAPSYDDDTLERIQREHVADPSVKAGRLVVDVMTWYCPAGTMVRGGSPVDGM
jgi:hypothetical protein